MERVERVLCALPGLDGEPSLESWPEEIGRSEDPGRGGRALRMSLSVDLERERKDLPRLDGCELLSGVPRLGLLPHERQTEFDLESSSFLLFSRLRVPKPNRFRNDDALELKEPVFTERIRPRGDSSVGVALTDEHHK